MKKPHYYQKEADDAIHEELLINDKCIVKMFCGTGKSLIMRRCKTIEDKKLVVFVFPSLSLIRQFYEEYLNDYNAENILQISSEDDATTNPIEITQFLSKINNKIICITYHSFKTLLDNLGEIIIDVCIFDEAHHAVGETYQKSIFENKVCDKQIFFTATPKNANGIIMYDREQPDDGVCGNLVYDYSCLRGIDEDYLNPFEIRIDMFTENTNKSVFESIARAILSTGNSRVLTFHSDVNTDRDTSVMNFVDNTMFKAVFKQIQKTEFPLIKKYTKVHMTELSSSVKPKQRDVILKKFDKTDDDEIMIISSCETIGEGIDTKNANMCVFVDPKSSYVKIIQNIGRIVRKQFGIEKPKSTILIPCWVDKSKYLECGNDKEECDAVIRQDMSVDGNFNGILNVLSALKQEDEDLYDICLNYPNTYSPKEIRNNLLKQGYTILEPIGDGGLVENIGFLLDNDVENDVYRDCETDEDRIMCIASDSAICVEIHTNSLETPIEKYNSECDSGEIVRLYLNVDDVNPPYYQPIVKNSGEKKNKNKLAAPKQRNKKCINVHTNPDVKVLWNISSDFDITKDICSCVIDCQVSWYEANWRINLAKLITYMDLNKKAPSKKDKLDDVKTLGRWVLTQKQNYKNKQYIMKKPAILKEWEDTVETYKEYLCNDNEGKWRINLAKLKTYMDSNNKAPSAFYKNNDVKTLGKWISTQKQNYNKKKNIMENPAIRKEWEDTLETYKEYLYTDNEENWRINLAKLKAYIGTNRKRPSENDKNNDVKFLGRWVNTQKTNYKNKTQIMENPAIRKEWEDTVETYKEYLCIDNVENWHINLAKLKAYMSTNKKRPSPTDKNEDIKILCKWVNTQKTNYKNKTQIMENPAIRKEWEDTVETYKEYICNDNEENWHINLAKLKAYMSTNKKRPSPTDKNEDIKILCKWVSHQITNYKNKKQIMTNPAIRKEWEDTMETYKEYIFNNEEKWRINLAKLKTYMSTNKKAPSNRDKDVDIKPLVQWVTHQKQNYKNNKDIMTNPAIRKEWEDVLVKYKEYLKQDIIYEISTDDTSITQDTLPPKPKKSMKLKIKAPIQVETTKQKRERVITEISLLHKRYKTMRSDNLHNEFNEKDNDLWKKYHEISEENEKSFPEEEIPRNRIIAELNKCKPSRTKTVVDMGCGKGQISQHFQNDKRFDFINYDHISSGDNIISCDISKTPLEDNLADICILSLAMWGSNCKEYIKEANRILESGGKLYIIEPTKRWSEKDENGNIMEEKGGTKMKSLLETSGFHIVEQSIEKFCMFYCMKNN